MKQYQHILFATDLSPANDATTERAIDLSYKYDAKLSVIHVVEPLPTYGYGYTGFAEFEEKLIEKAREAMEKLAEKLKISSEDMIIEVGSVKAEILRVAEKKKVDLIIMGTYGRHGISHLLGSTTSAVLHGTRRDVLIVHVDDFKIDQ